MHILSIFTPEEDTKLRQISSIVKEEDFSNNIVKQVIQNIQDSLSFYGNWVGLSAIQIGYPLQIFMINCKPTKAFPDMQEFKKIIINPTITQFSKETFDGREWCMSIADEQCIPQKRYQVRRSTSIMFDYTDEDNIRYTDQKLSWIAAVVFQHEYDHLFGRLIDQTGIPWKIISNDEYQKRKNNWEKMMII